MQVAIKRFNVQMDIKSNGLELEVHDNAGAHLGDLVITKTKVVWCQGRTRPENGKALTWQRFITMMDAT